MKPQKAQTKPTKSRKQVLIIFAAFCGLRFVLFVGSFVPFVALIYLHPTLTLNIFVAWTNRLSTLIVGLSLHEGDGGGAQVIHDANRAVE